MVHLFARLSGLAAALTIGLAASAAPVSAAPAPAQPAGAVPAGFRVQSATWSSPRTGWALGTTPCETTQCTTVATTHDAGRTWSATGTLPAPLAPPGKPGVTRIRFADPWHGWAFGPSLYATLDGGRSWHPAALPGAGRQAVALATAASVVYLAVSPCPVGQPAWQCSAPTTLWRSNALVHRWRPAPVTLPVTAGDPVVTIALSGPTAYVAAAGTGRPDVFYAGLAGIHWAARPSPCDKSIAASITDVVAQPGGRVAILCVGGAGFSRSTKRVYWSDDTGVTDRLAGTAPRLGITSQLAVTPSGRLAIASTSYGNWIYTSQHGTHWTTALGEAGAGWNDLEFASDRIGSVIDGPARFPTGDGTLLITRDGGQHWATTDFRSGARRP